MELATQIIDHLLPDAGPCYPDWEAMFDTLDELYTESEMPKVWDEISRFWVCGIQQTYGAGYEIYETENFLILSKDDKRSIKHACKSYEQVLKDILRQLPGVALDEGYGKHVILMFGSEDEYYRYISHFYPEGNHAASGGLCINSGYTHLAFPRVDYDSPKTTVVHELTHVCLSHLPLPAWLNEALAMRMEQVLCGTITLSLDRHSMKLHEAFWNPDTIQSFWSGLSWHTPGDSNPLSYALAEIIWQRIENDLNATQEEILTFISEAHYEDAGEPVFQEIFGLSLADLVASFLGEDTDWSPRPQEWEMGQSSSIAGSESGADLTEEEARFIYDVDLNEFVKQEQLGFDHAMDLVPVLESRSVRYVFTQEEEEEDAEQVLCIHREDIEKFSKICVRELGSLHSQAAGKKSWKDRLRGHDFDPDPH